MIKIDLKKIPHRYLSTTKTFGISEKNVAFDTSYELHNPKTGNSEIFEFSHSTGPEFDINTIWVYKNKNGYTLNVFNDEKTTKLNEINYIKGKKL